ncbi:hypothetical protein M6D81_25655 [Paenibacillus sp. J5C_2022]|nr:hypothetical protein [Paenibacillus sp. J5C2022]
MCSINFIGICSDASTARLAELMDAARQYESGAIAIIQSFMCETMDIRSGDIALR